MTFPGGRAMLRVVTALLIAAMLAGSACALFLMRDTGLRGDEYTYVAAAQRLGQIITGKAGFSDESARIIIGPGWFMPGIALAGAPLFALMPKASFLAMRAWMLSINLALWAGLARNFARTLGPVGLLALLVCPSLAAAWLVLATSYFPDLTAGLLATFALLAACRIGTGLLRGQSPGWAAIVRFEAWSVLALAFRGPQILPLLATHGLLLVLARGRRTALARIGTGLIGCALCLAPWSVLVSRHFDAPVLTTTNVPLVLADSFGDPARTCFGPCPPGEDIWPAWQFAHRQAQRTGANELALQRAMMRQSLAGLTVRSYLGKVRQHFGPFLFDPAGMVRQYMPVAYGIPRALRLPLCRVIAVLTWAVYAPFLLALFAANLGIFRRNDEARLQSLLIKMMTACLFLQPFLHKCSARYWVTFAPLAAWSAALLITTMLHRTTGDAPARQSPWLDRAQAAYALAFAAMGATLAFF